MDMHKLILLGLLLVALLVGAGTAPAGPPSANGRIAFAQATCASTCTWNLMTANPDGSHETVLAGPFGQDAFDNHLLANWSRDGRHLAFMAHQKIWEIDADGNHLHVVFTPPAGTGVDDDPTFTPDGKHLVFTRCCPEGFGYSLWMIGTHGTGLRDITTEPQVNGNGPADTLPQVSPNGNQIVFNRCADACAVDVVRRNGHGMHQISPDGMDVSTTGNFSPSGDEIVFSAHASPDVHSSLWIIRTNGTHLRQIVTRGLACGGANADPNGISCLQPRFSPDGTRIIFSSASSAGSNIYSVDTNGTGLVQITRDGGDDSPTWGPSRT
jgi:Tol biopolymer transport system component